MLIDTHTHLDNPLLDNRLAEIIATAVNCGVERFIIPGLEPKNWERLLAISEGNERVFAAPGVHPMHADKWNQGVAAELKKLTADIVAVGEIGLDFSAGMPSRELQIEVFRAQLKIARDASLPVIIHCRRAFADTVRILAEEKVAESGGVMHAFSGSLEIARICISMGLKIGIAGSLTWSNAVRPVTVAAGTALQHLLLETDSPDLTPEQHRGESNEPAFLIDTARKLAEIKGLTVAEVARVTAENTRLVFQRLK